MEDQLVPHVTRTEEHVLTVPAWRVTYYSSVHGHIFWWRQLILETNHRNAVASINEIYPLEEAQAANEEAFHVVLTMAPKDAVWLHL